jgi:hypothetical protein
MRSAIRSYLHGAIESAEYQLWHNESWAREWISNVNPWVIVSVVRGATDQPESWGRAWKWLALSGPELYNRSGSIPESIIGILLSSSRGGYTDTVVTSWSEILRRIPASATGSSYLKACSQAVGFAFSNPTLYLAPVVAQSFFEVHRAATSNEHLPHEASALFSYFDWDRAKELRRQLVEYFFRTNHPPRYLALASREAWLLRKIAKRTLRKWGGENYLHRVLDDLRANPNAAPGGLLAELETICSNPGYVEEWD